LAGVYISFPFCAQKCSFCNFASGVFPRELEREYLLALTSEIASHPWTRTPETVYLGGGTPSRIGPADLHSVLSAIPGLPWREATIEAAPASLTAAGIRSWQAAGITRVSLGVQSFVTKELAQTGRRHSAATVEADCRLLRASGISDINIDLIAGLPWQTPESWAESLDAVERLMPPHVSVYMFEVDEDSRLGLEVIQNGGRYSAPQVPDGDRMADLYQTAVDRLRTMGIERYEISNFAIPGKESLHNLKYWVLEPYIGFGADAHSFDQGLRWGNVESAAAYVARWKAGLPPSLEATAAIMQEERFFVGLRLMRGVRADAPDWERYGSSIERLREAGLLLVEGDRLRLTSRGVLLSNEVFGEFIS
jgi:oxygen-independent coproporphyrinogen-3 oxidase